MPRPKINEKKKGGFGIASLVLGILGLFVGGIPLGILAIIFGAVGLSKNQKFSLAGLILGIIDFVVGLIIVIAMGIAMFGMLGM